MGVFAVLLLVLVALTAGVAAGWFLRAGQVATLVERLQGQERLMDEKLSVLNEAREKLKEAFQALSSEALRSNNQSFLTLAKSTLETFQEPRPSSLPRAAGSSPPPRSSRGRSPRPWRRRGRHTCSGLWASCAPHARSARPALLVSVLEAALVSLAAMVERARAMLRAREARRTGPRGVGAAAARAARDAAWASGASAARCCCARSSAPRPRSAPASRAGPTCREREARRRSRWTASPTTTRTGTRRCARCPSASRRASASRCSGRTAPASRRCCCTSRGLLPERQRYLHRHDPAAPAHRHDVQGRVAIDGVTLARETIPALRARVGIVFEDPEDQVVGLTVEEDVAYGPRARRWPQAQVDAAVRDALAAVGLSGRESRFPHHLSAGEKRRLCLAGALACRPGLLLLDEPSSGLDPRGRRELGELLAGLDATQVVASHDLAFVERLCPRAIVLDGGAVVADAADRRAARRRARCWRATVSPERR